MATRRDVRRYGDATTDTFATVGDDEDQVVNVSGAPSPNTEMLARPRTVTAAPPGQRVSRRTPVEINADTGQRLGTRTERALTDAVGKLSTCESVDQAHPSIRPTLEHLFGLNLPGRDRV
jgi:hypothetical protein